VSEKTFGGLKNGEEEEEEDIVDNIWIFNTDKTWSSNIFHGGGPGGGSAFHTPAWVCRVCLTEREIERETGTKLSSQHPPSLARIG
jgi:hypothetical protein